CLVSFYVPGALHHLHSFPTRRSSDLPDNNDQGETTQARLGIRVQPITPDLQRQLKLDSTDGVLVSAVDSGGVGEDAGLARGMIIDRKSTRLNSSHVAISYAVFCLKKK